MSDSEDEEIFESLIATRARRANAGSRLKQLIELEEQAPETQASASRLISEDDENVNLLFQEDGDDQDFIDEDVENANLDGLDEEEGEEDEEEVDQGDGGEEDTKGNSDEQLSDSDLSASDSDESEGEKELQKQEKISKRRRKTVIPTIKKTAEKSPAKKKRKIELVTSESLLLSNRRSSSRASALESKQALIDRLKESEKRKEKYVHVERKKEKALTQEERLAQAVETEKENIESLNRFKEQEIVKKERQRLSLLSKRVKLQNVLRFTTRAEFVTPMEEVAEARHQYELYMRKRKRLGKKKKGSFVDESMHLQMPFSIDYDSPYQKALARERDEKMKKELDKLEIMNTTLMEKLIDKAEETSELCENSAANSGEKQMAPEEMNAQESHANEDGNYDDKEKEKDEQKVVGEEQVGELCNPPSVQAVPPSNENADPHDELAAVQSKEQTVSDIMQDSKSEKKKKVETISEDVVDKHQQDKELSEVQNSNSKEGEVELADSLGPEEVPTEDFVDTPSGNPSETVDQVVKIEDAAVVPPTDDNLELVSGRVQTSSLRDKQGSMEVSSTESTPAPSKRVKFVDEVTDTLSTENTPHPEEASKKEDNSPSNDQVDSIVTNTAARSDAPQTENTSPPSPAPAPAAPVEVPKPISPPPQDVEIFEGPLQKIARNLITLVDFNEEKRDLRLTPSNIKTIFFGKQSLLPASRRSNDVKTILTIGKKENPYATPEAEVNDADWIFTPASRITEDDPMFDELKKLPRLGVNQDIVEIEEDTEVKDSAQVVIHTEAPTGLYLPNGNKKACMITGTEVKYFDPSTGIPYSSVEAYKTLKLIEQGQAQWLSLDADANDTGAFDLYLGFKGESARHAKGVPEGFDG
ncbi:uncharacterized protein LODBEIA_P42360 [Lodderomyces beijingensis]|uniref:Vps72/YL1 C-terminal domain-containing protein n=1 Tax=Lodderomyces beijingensis TaxID=1775926 RepID=A0ABP0ZRN4_9ASCO